MTSTDTYRTLVSSGAYKFAVGQAGTIPPESLITPRTYEHWKKWKNRLDSSEDARINQDGQLHTADERLEDIQDTVGAVAWHGSDGLAAGVSRSVCTTSYVFSLDVY